MNMTSEYLDWMINYGTIADDSSQLFGVENFENLELGSIPTRSP